MPLNPTRTYTKAVALEESRIIQESDPEWTYMPFPIDPDNPEGMWIISVYDENKEFLGSL